MATTKKKKTSKKESTVSRLIREVMNLSAKDQLEVISRGMGMSLDTDNHGQIIIYTDLMYKDSDDGGSEVEVVDFETECLKDHLEDEEEEEFEL